MTAGKPSGACSLAYHEARVKQLEDRIADLKRDLATAHPSMLFAAARERADRAERTLADIAIVLSSAPGLRDEMVGRIEGLRAIERAAREVADKQLRGCGCLECTRLRAALVAFEAL